MVVQPLIQDELRRLGPHYVEPPFTGGILLFDNPTVPIVAIQLQLQKRMGHGPTHATVLDPHVRGSVREHPVIQGTVMPIPCRFGIETCHVVIQQKGVAGGDEITAVSEAFPVRTIGLYAK